MGLKLSVDIRCNGMFSYTIADPMLFYTNVASNVEAEYTRDQIDATLKSEMLNALQPALAKLSAAGIQYFEIPGKTMEIRDAMNEVLSREWGELRGLKMRNVSINSLTIPDEQKKKITEWEDILRSSLLEALQPALAQISAQKVEYSELPAHTFEIRNALSEVLRPDWTETRGIELVKLTINSLSIPEDQRKKITEWEENAMTTNPMMAGSRLVGAQADAMRTAAANEGGAMTGFMGMGMAQNAGGMNAQNLFAMGQQMPQQAPAQAAPAAPADGWKCSCGAVATGKFCSSCGAKKPEPKIADGWKCACGAMVTGKFCTECGAKKPEEAPAEDGWKCSCGAVNKGKFCPECGGKKPADAPLYQCDKCGWKPADPKNPPKFCPECGDVFDESDAQ